jgi:cytochrome P450
MESLRVMPPVPMTFRMSGKTQMLDNILIPKNTLFYIPVRLNLASYPLA